MQRVQANRSVLIVPLLDLACRCQLPIAVFPAIVAHLDKKSHRQSVAIPDIIFEMQAPMQQAIPPPGVQGQYGPAPGSGYPPQGYPQPQNMGANPQGGYPIQASIM